MTGNRDGGHGVDTGMRHLHRIAATIAATLLLAACARPGGPAAPVPDPAGPFAERARAVAAAWAPVTAGSAWREGLIPLADLTVAPPGLTEQQRNAVGLGRFTSAVELPGAAPRRGLVSARAAYEAMRGPEAECPQVPDSPPPTPPAPQDTGPDGSVAGPAIHDCVQLRITGATLGSTSLRTSRGVQPVPAWLFTVAGLTAPVARVALADPAPPPEVTVPEARSTAFTGAIRLTGVDGDRLTFTIGIGACQEGAKGLLHETAGAVVLGGDPGRSTANECIDLLAYEPVTVTLDRPLGGRPVVDVSTGRLLPLTARPY